MTKTENPEISQILLDLQIEYDSSLLLTQNPFGLITTKLILPGQVLAKIPQDSILSIKNTAISEILFSENITGLLGLALVILYERSLKTSPWYEYLSLINKSEYLPILWSPSHQSLLTNTDVGNALKEDLESLQDDYENIIVPLLLKYPILPKIDLQDYMNASSLVTSRGFYVDEERGECLIPFGDLLNHSLSEDVHFTTESDDEDDWESEDEDIPQAEVIDKEAVVIDTPVMEMIAIKEVKPNQEVFNTYGKHSNTDLLRLYGFCLKDNCFDYVEVTRDVILAKVEGDFEERIEFWEQVGGAVVEQLTELQQDAEDEDGSAIEEDEVDDEDEGDDDEEMEGEGHCKDENCHDEDCQACDDEDPVLDDFAFESTSKPSFALSAFLHLLLIPDEEFVEMAMELEKTIDYLVKIKNLMGDSSLYPRINEIYVAIAQDRLAGYPEWKGGKEKVFEYVKILRDGEIKILKGVVEKYQK